MTEPPVWTKEQLDKARKESEQYFAQSRHTEPLELYLALFDEYQGVVEEFLEQTVDLTRLEEHALALLSDPKQQEVFRYVTGPPVSVDDLKVLSILSPRCGPRNASRVQQRQVLDHAPTVDEHDWPGALKACLERTGKRSKLIENEPQFEATRQKIAQLHALLLEMKRQVPHAQYIDMAQAFLADIQRMEAEMREARSSGRAAGSHTGSQLGIRMFAR